MHSMSVTSWRRAFSMCQEGQSIWCRSAWTMLLFARQLARYSLKGVCCPNDFEARSAGVSLYICQEALQGCFGNRLQHKGMVCFHHSIKASGVMKTTLACSFPLNSLCAACIALQRPFAWASQSVLHHQLKPCSVCFGGTRMSTPQGAQPTW